MLVFAWWFIWILCIIFLNQSESLTFLLPYTKSWDSSFKKKIFSSSGDLLMKNFQEFGDVFRWHQLTEGIHCSYAAQFLVKWFFFFKFKHYNVYSMFTYRHTEKGKNILNLFYFLFWKWILFCEKSPLEQILLKGVGKSESPK